MIRRARKPHLSALFADVQAIDAARRLSTVDLLPSYHADVHLEAQGSAITG
ncbi:Uncharacterised protein [Amycolatopsis camponoti]|uniref:Uncharacterized protein n=1 Tax=Amycolatopsis camponoti TaxID=2606593 RepID=A0A6I8M7U9_9PSEU|nr:hypothetical protein [Amycolatopsis camponoti]VVJ23904.1 Uncharacterised protein [Amycolatopsis camponoti]